MGANDNGRFGLAPSRGEVSVLEAQAKCQNSYASNTDCSFAAWTTENACAAAATTQADGGHALTAACAAHLAANPGSCGADAG